MNDKSLRKRKEPERNTVQYGFRCLSQFELDAATGMLTASKQDQKSGVTIINEMVKTIKGNEIGSEKTHNPLYYNNKKKWDNLFLLIKNEHAFFARNLLDLDPSFRIQLKKYSTLIEEKISLLYSRIPQEDLLRKALESIHPKNYLLQNVIPACIVELKCLEQDVIYTHEYFQATLEEIEQICHSDYDVMFNLGLPSHHAFVNKPAGFCIINKLAVMMAYEKLQHADLDFFVIGLDVNQDNGLMNCLKEARNQVFSGSDIKHIDVYDSGVYPYPIKNDIQQEFNRAFDPEENPHYSSDSYEYCVFDLSVNPRKIESSIHPVMKKSIDQLETKLKNLNKDKKLMVVVPLGWDSHQKETAPCGKMIKIDEYTEKKLTYTQALNMRFSDHDMDFFYNELFKLKNKYPDKIHRILISLEGGYNNTVNKKQIKILNNNLEKNFNNKYSSSNKKNNSKNNAFFKNTSSDKNSVLKKKRNYSMNS